ncbi:AraC family transcriptional regulator [Pelagibaculum spongiae]|uniref:AraC family transcriptional regulator n=1 Tax=Pelagibaculum spongiae TaxID=2080658 RepID=A0A2V1GWV8_9GAMM|nr:AraC family transcriptional regulator [Pelagibaculum spongiae]PVZ65686.1 AraC family transcriptional regulator [Pelagibaculum spongiae]
MSYLKRYQKVIEYIERHLSQPMTLDLLCQKACLSKFHFHRQFQALFGCTLAVYIKRQRMRRALHQLYFRKQMRVIDIALENGYENPESFSRAFKEILGVSPSQFRKEADWNLCQSLIDQLNLGSIFMAESQKSDDWKVERVDFPKIRLAVLEHLGDPKNVMQSVAKFIDWRISSQLLPRDARLFNLIYDDPEKVAAEDFRLDIAAETKVNIPDKYTEMVEKSIAAGRCARIRHVGSDKNMAEKIYYLYSQWMINSGETLRDAPLFFEWIAMYPDVPENEQVVDIYLPIE